MLLYPKVIEAKIQIQPDAVILIIGKPGSPAIVTGYIQKMHSGPVKIKAIYLSFWKADSLEIQSFSQQ